MQLSSSSISRIFQLPYTETLSPLNINSLPPLPSPLQLHLLVPGIYQCTFWLSKFDYPVVVQSLSHIQLFAIPRMAALQASMSFTMSQSLLKLMSWWMASLTQWKWVWASWRSWWWTGKPGTLQSMGLQRIRHDWATELNWAERIHWVGDAIQPSHPLSFPSPSAFNISKHQGLFQWVDSSHQVAKLLELQLQHQSFQWMFRVDCL